MFADDHARLTDVLSRRFGESLKVDEQLAGVGPLLRMASHSTHRQWSPQPVPESTIRLLAACALSAPSKSDLQQASIIDIRDPQQRQAINELVPQFPWVPSAPAFLVFCADGHRIRSIFEHHATPFINEHLDQFFNAVVDGSLVMMNFMQAAETAGLACCPISMIRNHPSRLDEILSLPQHVVPIAGLCLGYPQLGGRVVSRLPLSLTVHRDRYPESDVLGQVHAYDARRRTLENASPEAASWSVSKRDQYANLQRPDWGDYVRSKGFSTT
ncbi:MAG: nitroreductase family protein [Burkholderiales bacterium]|nr:nitroreductase family protein [Burkholderiales bacterium]